MKIAEARPESGTLPGYLSQKEAAKVADLPIGTTRLLTITEEGDMLAAGLTREQIADMTPEVLQNQADLAVNLSDTCVGC